MSQMELPLAFRELPECMGCGQPIEGEPFIHHSAMGVWFIAHDFECCLKAHEKEWKRRLHPVENPQHDDLERGIK